MYLQKKAYRVNYLQTYDKLPSSLQTTNQGLLLCEGLANDLNRNCTPKFKQTNVRVR